MLAGKLTYFANNKDFIIEKMDSSNRIRRVPQTELADVTYEVTFEGMT